MSSRTNRKVIAQDTLEILGAWGCGVFRNDPADVARYFREAITGEYANLFELVRFSVLDRPDGHAIAAFKGCYASLLA